jgi:hypothetical protein
VGQIWKPIDIIDHLDDHRPKYLIQGLCRENLMMEYYFDQPTVFSVSLNEGNSGFPNLVDHCLESFHKTP